MAEVEPGPPVAAAEKVAKLPKSGAEVVVANGCLGLEVVHDDRRIFARSVPPSAVGRAEFLVGEVGGVDGLVATGEKVAIERTLSLS